MRGYGVLQIEPTDHCNLSCKMCRPHYERWETIHSVPKGFLSTSLWKEIVQHFVAEHIEWDHIIFQWLGDPLLHPHLSDLIEEAQSLKDQVNYLRVDTNCIQLTEERAKRLISSAEQGAPVLLVCSVDALSEDVYRKVKGYPMRDLVYRNIRNMIRLRRQSEAQLNIQLQFVVQQENAHEAKEFWSYWTSLLECQGGGWHDEILFKPLSVDGGGEGQARSDVLYRQTLRDSGICATEGNVATRVWNVRPWQVDDQHKEQRKACPGLWYTPVVRHDGELMLCCADLQGEMSLGNLNKSSFLELWQGSKATKKRLQHLNNDFTGVCADCGGINWYSLPEDAAERVHARAEELGVL